MNHTVRDKEEDTSKILSSEFRLLKERDYGGIKPKDFKKRIEKSIYYSQSLSLLSLFMCMYLSNQSPRLYPYVSVFIPIHERELELISQINFRDSCILFMTNSDYREKLL